MGLTYKKRDDLDKVLEEFAFFPEDLLKPKKEEDEGAKKEEKKDGEKESK